MVFILITSCKLNLKINIHSLIQEIIGWVGVASIFMTGFVVFLMMFPTTFALRITGLGHNAKLGVLMKTLLLIKLNLVDISVTIKT